jgi:hypothetical protein
MRTMIKLQVPVAAGNDAIKSGRIAEVLGALMSNLHPEAAYFGAEGGERTAYIFFDLTDPSRIPVIAEPLFQNLDASVEISPVMNLDELQSGLAEVSQS